MGKQGVVHHGENLLACTAGLLGFVAYPVEGQFRQPAILAGVDADDDEAGDGLGTIGQGAALTVGRLTIAVGHIEAGEVDSRSCGGLGGFLAVVDEGIAGAKVVIAGNDEGLDAALA